MGKLFTWVWIMHGRQFALIEVDHTFAAIGVHVLDKQDFLANKQFRTGLNPISRVSDYRAQLFDGQSVLIQELGPFKMLMIDGRTNVKIWDPALFMFLGLATGCCRDLALDNGFSRFDQIGICDWDNERSETLNREAQRHIYDTQHSKTV